MESRCARYPAKRARVEVQLHDGAGARQVRELGAFVRYCVSRIERELGEIAHWSVTIVPAGGRFSSRVAIDDGDTRLEAVGTGIDGALAAWDALCRLEQRLRETRAQRIAEGGSERAGEPLRRVASATLAITGEPASV
jgi:hypothetical protein